MTYSTAFKALLITAAFVISGCAVNRAEQITSLPKAAQSDSCRKPSLGMPVDPKTGCAVVSFGGWNHYSVFFPAQAPTTDFKQERLLTYALEAILRESPNIKVAMIGRTDGCVQGAAAIALGAARMRAVESYLISKGVDPQVIRTRVSYGNTDPIPDHDQKPGECASPANNRVDVVLTQ